MRRQMPVGVRRRLGGAAVLLVVATSSVGCGPDPTVPDPVASPAPSSTPASSGGAGAKTRTPTPSPVEQRVTIDITVSGGEITPNGEAVEVPVGEKIDLVVTADAPGEIHVHSDPEAEFAYEGNGRPETFTLQIDRPGQVEVESHTLEKLIVKLVVS